jgi:hypothetical protein
MGRNDEDTNSETTDFNSGKLRMSRNIRTVPEGAVSEFGRQILKSSLTGIIRRWI